MPTAEHVMRHAAERPSRLAVCGPKARLTYAELADRVQGAARHLLGRGAGPGTLVAIGLRDPVALLTAALAADLAGATPLVGDPSWSRARWSRVLTPETAAAETPAADVSAPPPATDTVLDVPAPFAAGLVVDVPLPYASGPPVWHEPKPQDLAWACVTSGSTGRPRAIVRSRASWTDSFEHLSELAGIGRDDVVLVPGPLVSSLYAFAAVHALATGATALLPGRRPSTAQAAGATVVHLVPHLLPDLLARAGSLRAAVVGGAALGPGPREQAARAGVRVMSYYGATELSFVAADIDGGGLRPFPGVEIEVRLPGAEERRAPLGEVWVRSPWLAEGYLGDAAGPLRRDGDGWVSVGDVAEPYRSGGALRVRGRGDGAIQTGGATVVPEDVEEVLRKVPGVADVVVVGTPHPSLGAVVTAVVEAEQAAPPPRALLEAAARDGLDAAQRPRRWHAVPSMPRTPAGKPARALIAARLADGDPLIRRLA
ncbi:AMP-binding protein [Nonomuraea phyllanthi]|uniref:class I adenylate-forming enzyme family protein n=1 Tax=Nonomuraea phyllanthi TaxID=2219224 RepID=UPI0012936B96|nr:AMP-binding protein [Nonomuraea phyllanthi]QFY09474.1 AMP-binding protein [Nonomuraea phyllanthi]